MSSDAFLAGALLGNVNTVKSECMVIGFSKPDQWVVLPRETEAAVQPIPEAPDDAVAHLQTKLVKDGVQSDVKRNDAAVVDIVAHLPAQTATVVENADTLLNHSLLLSQIVLQSKTLLIRLPEIVWRRRNNELHKAVRYLRRGITKSCVRERGERILLMSM